MVDKHKTVRDTESLILQAAEKEFLKKGFSGAKTTSIAEAAGVTHAMLHYYFRTKDKLFEKIISDKFNNISEILLGAISNIELPLKERIRQGIESHFEFLATNPDLPRFIVNELAEHPERIEPVIEGFTKNAKVLLANLQQELDKIPEINTDARMLLSDIISINIFPFIAAPMIKNFIGYYYGNYNEYLELRKKENVKTIFQKLKIE